MSYKHTWSTTWKDGSDSTSTTAEVITANAKANFSDLIGVDASNAEIDIAFPFGPIQSVAIVAGANMDLYTNAASGGSPDNHIVLVAGKIAKWTINSVTPCPFDVDVTKIYVTKSGAAASLVLSVLYDATP